MQITSTATSRTMTTTKLALSFLCLYFTGASLGKAQSFGDFDYELINGDAEVRITEYTGSGVSHVTVPDSIDGKLVTEIGANAFEFASNPRGGTNNGFDTISLPSNLKTIREQAFTAAILTAIVIPDSVTVIESGAFESCPNLASVTLSENLAEISADLFADCNSLLSIVIPESVLTIGDGAFSSCNALNSITLSSQLQTIGISAFDSCTSLSSIVLPETLTTIGNMAFRTTGLVSVVIPAAVDSIGINAFGNCDALTGITVDAANLSYSSENGILFDKTKTLLMRYPPTKAGEYVVPASVTDISDSAFSESVLLTEVTLPSAMNTIADNAFWSCTLLQTVKMPDTLTTLGQRAFGGCSSLKRMELPAGITKVPFNCFGACTGLEYLTIPEGVTSIEQFAFNLCTNLKRIVFPTTLTTKDRVHKEFHFPNGILSSPES